MRKTRFHLKFFCMAILLSVISLGIYAQGNNEETWKNEKITVRVSNESLGTILEKVAHAAKAKITLQGVTLTNINQPTSINVTDTPIDKVLGELLEDQNVKIRFEGNRRIIIESYKQEEELLP